VHESSRNVFHAEARRNAEAQRTERGRGAHGRLNADPKVLLLEVWMERDRAPPPRSRPGEQFSAPPRSSAPPRETPAQGSVLAPPRESSGANTAYFSPLR